MFQPKGHYVLGLSCVLAVVLGAALPASGQIMSVRHDVHHDISPALRSLPKLPRTHGAAPHEAGRVLPIPLPAGLKPPGQPDSVLQKKPPPGHAALAPSKLAPAATLNFPGLGNGQFGFTIGVAPPDTNGAVGATQYVQWVNASIAVFKKATGALVSGPTAANALWAGFGGGCQTNNAGDGVVVYDKLANRWVISQFSGETTPYLQCVAVSTSSDATGTYFRYSFQYNNFNDYPKMGVWPDAYYVTFNVFNLPSTFLGANACAYNRSAMLTGAAAAQVCFQQPASVGGLLPSDLDGTTPPPGGSPNYLLNFGANSLNLFKFHIDFSNTANSTFTGPTAIGVAAFSPLCGGGTCVPQPGTSQQLDSLADRLMFRLAYRNFGTHESLVVNHSVAAGSSGGIRWYEIQNPAGTPVVTQQSTFAPDSSFRWMGSIAMDHVGDMAVGYTVSNGATVFPSVAYTGRVPTDPPSTMEPEVNLVSGSGSQNGGLTRWGDYSAMQVDPVDDCTFWYTQEFMKTSGSFNWNTQISNFKFANCNSTSPLHVHQLYYSNGWVDQDLTAITNGATPTAGSGLASFPDSYGEHAYFVATNQHVHQLYYSNGWVDQDLTTVTNGALATAGSALASFPDNYGEHAYFVAANQHVHQLYYNRTNWADQDLTANTSGALAIAGSGLASFSDNYGEHAYFVATNQHVHQLYFNHTNWVDQDLTANTHGALAIAGSSLASFSDSYGEHAYFVATNQHIHQLYFNNSSWVDQDLTTITSGALAITGSGLASFPDSYGEHAYFVAANQHVHQLYYNRTNWADQDLTANTNGALAIAGSALASFSDNYGEHAYFVATNQHVHQLYFNHTNWVDQDLTANTHGALAVATSGLTSFADNYGEHAYFVGN